MRLCLEIVSDERGTAKGIAGGHFYLFGTRGSPWPRAAKSAGRRRLSMSMQSFPEETMGKAIWLPTIRDTIGLPQNPSRAIDCSRDETYEAAPVLPPTRAAGLSELAR